MKVYTVDFEAVCPVGNCLVILAESFEEAVKIAQETIVHTKDFEVAEVDTSYSGVVVYLSGDY